MLAQIQQRISHRAARMLGRRMLPFSLERPIVSFTFDDFAKSAWRTGGAILGRYGARGTYYFCAENCGGDFEGVRQFDIEDVGALLEAGHELGCHTAGHQSLPKLAPSAIEAAIDANAAFAAKHFNVELTTFAYPFGDVSPAAKRVVSQRFNSCRGVWAGLNTGAVDLGLLSCVCLEDHILARKSATQWIADAARRNAWLVFLTHDVADSPTPYGVTPAAFEAVVRAAAEAGCLMLPVKEALSAVKADTRRPDLAVTAAKTAVATLAWAAFGAEEGSARAVTISERAAAISAP